MAKKAKQEALKPNVRPDDEAECFALYTEHRAEISRINQKIQALFKRYENMGVDTDAVKYAYALSQKDDAADKHRRRTQAAARLGVIDWDSDGQATMNRILAIEKPSPQMAKKLVLGRARADGYNTGFAGGLIGNCTFDPASEEFVVWREGWHQGAADRAEVKPEADGETAPAPRRRGKKAAEDAALH